jgi:hypothetical protein
MDELPEPSAAHEMIRLGNDAFSRRAYVEARICYEQASQLARQTGPPPALACAESNFACAKRAISLSADFTRPPPASAELSSLQGRVSDLIESKSLTAALFEVNRAMAIAPGDGHTLQLRAQIYVALRDYFCAFQDIKSLFDINAQNPEIWTLQAECALACDQDDLLLYACKQGQKRGCDMFVYYCRYLIRQRRLPELADVASLRLRIVPPTEKHLLRLRVRMNVMLGNYRNVFRDVEKLKQQVFPWRVFLADDFPVTFKAAHIGNPLVGFVVAGFIDSFSEPIRNISFDLGIAPATQLEWCDPGPDDACLTTTDYPPLCERDLDERKFPPSLLNVAIDFGRLIDGTSRDKRRLACLGFSLIECTQLFGETNSHVPHFFMALAIVANWLRLADPTPPIFLSRPTTFPVIYLLKNGIPTDLVIYIPEAFEILKTQLMREGLIQNEVMTKPDDLMVKRPIKAEIGIPGSPAKVFIKQSHFGHTDFGIELPNPGDLSQILAIWSSIFLNPQDSVRLAFLFLFQWFRSRPLMACSHEVGVCFFIALFNAIVGIEIREALPNFMDLELNALLASSFENFVERIRDKLKMQITEASRIEHLPLIEEVLPNMHLRAQCLLWIKEDDFGFVY